MLLSFVTFIIMYSIGPNGIYPSSSGLKMMYLSGREAVGSGKDVSTFTFNDISSLETQATNKPAIDILITSQWPDVVCNYAKKPVSFLFLPTAVTCFYMPISIN